MAEPEPPQEWVVKTFGQFGAIAHLGGVPWDEAPMPPRRHRCWPQTRHVDRVHRETEERCPCGGVRLDRRRPWIDRNTRTPLTAEELGQRELSKRWEQVYEAYIAAEQAEDHDQIPALRNQLRELADAMETP